MAEQTGSSSSDVGTYLAPDQNKVSVDSAPVRRLTSGAVAAKKPHGIPGYLQWVVSGSTTTCNRADFGGE